MSDSKGGKEGGELVFPGSAGGGLSACFGLKGVFQFVSIRGWWGACEREPLPQGARPLFRGEEETQSHLCAC